ncbi:lipoprotein 17-related variable surface protein [Mycoplasma tauri]|uniref:lipoprotein 17-related variable surface protein n=1 Tax=Mycoplasma tauri TaxID=547987 RepID=UPI001CC04EA8|nr:lipoprotein 17-related variable surface protein [Mycoplasma tauri]MBZ4218136.1 hypothetical protein [Mycoplasma tauri]
MKLLRKISIISTFSFGLFPLALIQTSCNNNSSKTDIDDENKINEVAKSVIIDIKNKQNITSDFITKDNISEYAIVNNLDDNYSIVYEELNPGDKSLEIKFKIEKHGKSSQSLLLKVSGFAEPISDIKIIDNDTSAKVNQIRASYKGLKNQKEVLPSEVKNDDIQFDNLQEGWNIDNIELKQINKRGILKVTFKVKDKDGNSVNNHVERNITGFKKQWKTNQ